MSQPLKTNKWRSRSSSFTLRYTYNSTTNNHLVKMGFMEAKLCQVPTGKPLKFKSNTLKNMVESLSESQSTVIDFMDSVS